ncbi:MAG: penicillin-binding protein 2 [Rikenellaceae bacterium]|nr:penicillin-binding protein 2 [Rikenellaceae bacterium]
MGGQRVKILQLVTVAVFAVIILRLFYIQVIDSEYKDKASNNVLRYEVQYPPRGEIYDRNGEFLVQSREVYDLMVVPRDLKEFDTLMMCAIVGITPDKLKAELEKAYRYSRRVPSVVIKHLPKEDKLKLDERNFPGFYTVYRTIRSYPRKIGGNLLGYVGEVDRPALERDGYYRSGDYIGKSGMELAYEKTLRGEKGVKVNMVDVHGMAQGSYADGIYDTLPTAGLAVTSTIDAALQALAEELLDGKVGSVVAIEPSTGEILVMASSPSYDPDDMVGREIGRNYNSLIGNPRNPLFNRSVQARYPPGSTFKVINGLIGMQEGVLTPDMKYSCSMGYTVGRGVKCHSHWPPLNLVDAVQTSCNAYFCYVMRNILDNRKYSNIKEAMEVWNDYVQSFGFGTRLGSDFIGEQPGFVPDAAYYDKKYNGRWNSLTVISLSIGQGELGCSPLQMANLAATIANRGHYYIPHVVKEIHGDQEIDERFSQKQFTKVDPEHFEPIVEGMYRAVHIPGGTAQRVRVDGLDICGKTGTAQNPHGADHSTFMCFAPRENPRIAVSVYIENGGFGATIAAPIASLLIEQYLNGEITRQYLVDQVKSMKVNYPYYDRQQNR